MSNPFLVAEDTALKAYLQGLTVVDEKAGTRTVKVWFGYPDVESRDVTWPFITIDLADIVPANDRQIQGRLFDDDYQGTQVPDGRIYTYDVPVAYDIVYQITTHSRHPRHDRSLVFQLLHRFPSKYGKLAVPNQLGTETAYRSMFLDGFTKMDGVEEDTGGARRILRNALTVRVVSEMSPLLVAEPVQPVEEVFLDKTPTPPSGFEMV